MHIGRCKTTSATTVHLSDLCIKTIISLLLQAVALLNIITPRTSTDLPPPSSNPGPNSQLTRFLRLPQPRKVLSTCTSAAFLPLISLFQAFLGGVVRGRTLLIRPIPPARLTLPRRGWFEV